jgi:membrane associated rhomboid family serine protease
MDPSDCIIRARSRRQVMDWALVLLSQNIEATIAHLDDGGWGLVTSVADQAAATAALRQYQIENRGWRWRQPLPGAGLVFHGGSALWVAAMVAAYYFCEARFPDLEKAGILDSQAVRAGQWWRLFTAMSLHENLPHLMANVTSGFLLLGLAMARYGAGPALLSAFLAGAAGNLAGVMIYSDHQSLGASGMVMGALGLLATQSLGWWRRYRPGAKFLRRAGAAALLVLVLVGFSPGTDVVAHVGGFLAGAIFGGVLSLARPVRLQTGPINIAAGILVIALALGTWALVR